MKKAKEAAIAKALTVLVNKMKGGRRACPPGPPPCAVPALERVLTPDCLGPLLLLPCPSSRPCAITVYCTAIDAKKVKGGGLVDTIKKRLLGGVHLTINIKDVHFRLERDEGTGTGAPPFAAGFILPEMGVKTVIDKAGNQETKVTIGRAGVYVETGKVESVIGESPSDCAQAERDAMADAAEVEAAEVGEEAGESKKRSAIARAKGLTSPRATAEQRAEQAAKKEAALARQLLFYKDQDDMRNKMHRVAERCAKQPVEEWFMHAALPAVAGEAPACVRASIHTIVANKAEPEKFDYETPLKLTRMAIGRIAIHASEAQMAALLSMSTLSADFKLWASYVGAKRRLGLPRQPSARQLWKAAEMAVNSSLHGIVVKGPNIISVITNSKAYKRQYTELLVDGVSSADKVASPVAVRDARAKLDADAVETGIGPEAPRCIPIALMSANERR